MTDQNLRPRVVTHWGTYTVDDHGHATGIAEDPDPSPIGAGLDAMSHHPARVLYPMVREGWLRGDRPLPSRGAGRGAEPFVRVSWDEAEALVAREVARVRDTYGSEAIYGGSYGWASAGRFHHAQSQIHRFLNVTGGYTRSVQNYSYAAGDVILPYVIGSAAGLSHGHTTWQAIRDNAGQIVMFGGMPPRNAQVNGGGMLRHSFAAERDACRAAGVRMVLVSPIGDDSGIADAHLQLRPGTDVALMLALAHEVIAAGQADTAFLSRYTVGWDRARAYVTGESDGVAKTPAWAAPITGLPADDIAALARSLTERPTFMSMSWSLQRARYGEQPYWMVITLAAILGTIGRSGLGFGFGYGSIDGIGLDENGFGWPKLGQGENPVGTYIPVARIADMLLDPGGEYDYCGERRRYPDIRLVYWAGGNPFHHHQDLNRLISAWRRPETVIVHEPWWTATARHSDIVLPVTLPIERDDIACSGRDAHFLPSRRMAEPPGESRNDFEILTGIACRMGLDHAFTEGLDAEAWLRRLYAELPAADAAEPLPSFDAFWKSDGVAFTPRSRGGTLLEVFRRDPQAHPLATPSGLIELYSATIAGFGLADCPPQATWLIPEEWLGAEADSHYPLHLLSSQPRTRLHSQMDTGRTAQASKVQGREPIRMSPKDAAARGIAKGDVVRVFNDRGVCLAGAVLSDALLPGVVQLSTGAWFDPEIPGQQGALDVHGNPNVLTRDQGASGLSQGPSAQSCLVEIERFDGPLPPIKVHKAPPTVE